MNYLLDDDDVAAPAEREFTLSTGSILGLFFGLVVLCGLFFGFGYSVGNHKAPPAAESSQSAPAATNFNAFKPAAGLPPGAPSGIQVTPQNSAVAPATTPAETPHSSGNSNAPAAASGSQTAAPIVRVAPAAATHTAPVAPSSTAAALGTFIVQVAAVSHQQDADLLLSALRAKGYAVAAFLGPDKFIRVQIGPFSNRHDAEVMRQRLSADGYSPIIK
jgi:cell division septation protein DedD